MGEGHTGRGAAYRETWGGNRPGGLAEQKKATEAQLLIYFWFWLC